MAEPRSAALTAASAVKGGATATCACVFTFSLSSFTSCTASAEVLCIFQFPQMNFRLAMKSPAADQPPRPPSTPRTRWSNPKNLGVLGVLGGCNEELFLQDFDPRKLAAFEEFKGG